MAARYLVRGELSGWFLFGRILAALAIVGGIVLVGVREPVGGGIVIAAGAVLALTVEAMAFAIRRDRIWLEHDDAGFTLIDRLGPRDFQDDDVHAIAFASEPVFSNGNPAGFTRTCTLWVAQEGDEPEPIPMANRFKQNQTDPLAGFFNRILERLRGDFDAALAAGHALEGRDWALTKGELTIRRKGGDESLPLAEITAAESRDGKISIWRRGTDEPYVGFPFKDRNVWLLLELLRPRIKNDAAQKQPAEGLGRVLFQRGPGKGLLPLLYIVAAGAFALGIGLLFAVEVPKDRFVGYIILAVAPLFAFLGYVSSKANFRCHEWGVHQSSISGEKKLRYADVGSFTYAGTRMYHNGAYAGTSLQLRFDPLPGAAGRPIKFTTTIKNMDADIESLRDHVSRIIAARMGRELNAGKSVPWTKRLTYSKEGFECYPAGVFGKKEWTTLPYAEYGGWKMDQGTFQLFQRGVKKSVHSEKTSEANFFPGFMLLQSMFHAK
jgi:hypothetical protein